MSQRIMTVAKVPGVFGGGYADDGRMSRAEIIFRTRKLAAEEIRKWTAVLSATDDKFDVRVVRGVHKQTLIERLLP